jgi:hypothetical protein
MSVMWFLAQQRACPRTCKRPVRAGHHHAPLTDADRAPMEKSAAELSPLLSLRRPRADYPPPPAFRAPGAAPPAGAGSTRRPGSPFSPRGPGGPMTMPTRTSVPSLRRILKQPLASTSADNSERASSRWQDKPDRRSRR